MRSWGALIQHDSYSSEKGKFGPRDRPPQMEDGGEQTGRRWPSTSQGERLATAPVAVFLIQSIRKVNTGEIWSDAALPQCHDGPHIFSSP